MRVRRAQARLCGREVGRKPAPISPLSEKARMRAPKRERIAPTPSAIRRIWKMVGAPSRSSLLSHLSCINPPDSENGRRAPPRSSLLSHLSCTNPPDSENGRRAPSFLHSYLISLAPTRRIRRMDAAPSLLTPHSSLLTPHSSSPPFAPARRFAYNGRQHIHRSSKRHAQRPH